MDNPLQDTPQKEARILAKAKELWTADGKPGCGPEAYKEAASELIGMESNPDAGQIPVESPVPLDANGQPIEQAWLEENLGNEGGSMNELDDKQEVPFATRKEEAEALKDQD
ncbi:MULTISPECIES: hypothetical protein [Novacetimonas]|uniref:DUF2934 domain-containing protein n=2 Tax=Novacetimonas TaxID=2919364 RepID=A0A318QHP2_9PROT|nr:MULTISPECIES: hypothetical protein [Novacetimonas]MBV1835011.1 hypothetical protein [Novacetimonas pomaceti]PYD48291.1 hypothetical protein C3920_05385 [Novacetimonas pomaceti]PYD74869.1 hypothetical protein CFR71_12215 [Novacetimonas pomaceti]RBM05376.1 hypothetical protein NJLHNGOC_13390 [Novacetimonas cocois]